MSVSSSDLASFGVLAGMGESSSLRTPSFSTCFEENKDLKKSCSFLISNPVSDYIEKYTMEYGNLLVNGFTSIKCQ